MQAAPKYIENQSHIFHYTDSAALISILEDQSMWFSDAANLNDSSEGIHLEEIYHSAAKTLIEELPADSDNSRAMRFLSLVLLEKNFIPQQQFVCCFSKTWDSLNQWTSYGKDTPYSIMFDRDEFLRATQAITGHKSYQFWHGDVEYDGEEKITKRMRKELQQFLESDPVDDHRQALYATKWIADSLMEMNSIRYKHRSFRFEDEYRVAITEPHIRNGHRLPDGTSFKTVHVPRPLYIRTTVVIKFGEMFRNMIKGIVVGPAVIRSWLEGRLSLCSVDSDGFRAFDALHVACAESGGAEALLTTDDRLRNRAVRHQDKIALRVENPAKWYSEVIAP